MKSIRRGSCYFILMKESLLELQPRALYNLNPPIGVAIGGGDGADVLQGLSSNVQKHLHVSQYYTYKCYQILAFGGVDSGICIYYL